MVRECADLSSLLKESFDANLPGAIAMQLTIKHGVISTSDKSVLVSGHMGAETGGRGERRRQGEEDGEKSVSSSSSSSSLLAPHSAHRPGGFFQAGGVDLFIFSAGPCRPSFLCPPADLRRILLCSSSLHIWCWVIMFL